MPIDTTFKPSRLQKTVWWTIESKQNSLAVAGSVIAFFVLPQFSKISYFYSFLVCSSSFYGMKFYLDYQKRITEERFHEHFQLLKSYFVLDKKEMDKIFNGYELNENGQKVKVKKYSRKKKEFLEVCETFKLVASALENSWAARPNNTEVDCTAKMGFIFDSMPKEVAANINRLEAEAKAKYPDI